MMRLATRMALSGLDTRGLYQENGAGHLNLVGSLNCPASSTRTGSGNCCNLLQKHLLQKQVHQKQVHQKQVFQKQA